MAQEIARRLVNGVWETVAVEEDSGGGALTVATVTLTNAQVLALPTTPVELIPAQGAETVIVPLLAVLRLNWVADYTNIDASAQILLRLGGSGLIGALSQAVGSAVGALLAGGGPDGTWGFCQLKQDVFGGVTLGVSNFYDADLANLALSISATNGAVGDFTGGNAGNALTVTVLYYLLTF